MRCQCLTFPLAAFNMVSNMMTQTMGKTLPATIQAVARQGLFFIPAVFLLPMWLQETGVQAAQSAADLCAFLMSVVIMRRVFRELREEEQGDMLLRHQRQSDLPANTPAPPDGKRPQSL